ncbi:cell division ATP-binding protein FtsE [Gracilibacillus thailandensis]|mgnify:CR=1 FL=1|uniref:Cell division ATP-binding protein FtsE n=1 Tax=Gracilibacillus thailandensis TaxID=563735 RepID=A0A6N7QYB6_9BACI|nr:cell division ATP-binding protein FtsE [Gracilibacillus thailandensis]MRI67058.1 cell division ATP-binding protein FtsE [Gracilibacillus thailandensis]
MIKMQEVYMTYPNGVVALNGVDVTIEQGEFVYIVGQSGAGKSTFTKMLFREEVPTKGSVVVNNTDITTLKWKEVPYFRRNIGVVYQDFRLLPKLTVYENIAFALEVIEESPKNIRKRVMSVLDQVGLKNKARFIPDELSGGEQQRVAIARAMVNHPALLIADEPTGNLDPETSWEIMRILEEINASGTTILMATHSKEIVNTVKRRVIAMEDGMIVRDEHRGEYGYEV